MPALHVKCSHCDWKGQNDYFFRHLFRNHKAEVTEQMRHYDKQKLDGDKYLMTADKKYTCCFACEKLWSTTPMKKPGSWALGHWEARGGCGWQENVMCMEKYTGFTVDIGKRDPVISAKVAKWFDEPVVESDPEPLMEPVPVPRPAPKKKAAPVSQLDNSKTIAQKMLDYKPPTNSIIQPEAVVKPTPAGVDRELKRLLKLYMAAAATAK